MGINPLRSLKKAIFLDRDGVVNESIVVDRKPFSPKNSSELKIISGVDIAINILKEHYLIFVVTNQPDIARGKLTTQDLSNIHNELLNRLAIDKIYFCPHDDNDHCLCRKPLPGMLRMAEEEYKLDLSKSYMIGDRWKDIDAGIAAGCKTVFIDYSYNETNPINYDYKVKNLLDFANILKSKK